MHPTQQTQTCNFAAWASDQRHAHAGPSTSELRLQIRGIKSQVPHIHEQTSDSQFLSWSWDNTLYLSNNQTSEVSDQKLNSQFVVFCFSPHILDLRLERERFFSLGNPNSCLIKKICVIVSLFLSRRRHQVTNPSIQHMQACLQSCLYCNATWSIMRPSSY